MAWKRPVNKIEDPESGRLPEEVKDDPYVDLFAECTTTEEVLELQREIEAAEANDH